MKRFYALIILTLAIAAAALGLAGWMLLEPERWFADDFATRQTETNLGLLQQAVADTRREIAAVQNLDDDSALQATITELAESLDEFESNITDLCAAISSSYVTANSATEDLLFELNLACP